VTRTDLAAIRAGEHRTTRATVYCLCDALEAVLDLADRKSEDENPWGLAQILFAKSVIVAVDGVPLK